MNFVGRWEVAKQLLGGCTYSAGGKFYECLNAFVRVAKRTFRFGVGSGISGDV